MTQRELASALRREHSFVWRIETGERRLDVVEFFWVYQALGQDARVAYHDLVDAFTAKHAYPLTDSPAKKAAEPPLSYVPVSRSARRRA